MRLLATVILTILLSVWVEKVSAQTDSILVTGQDTIRYTYTPMAMPAVEKADTVAVKPKKNNIFRRIVRYFAESSIDKSFEKKLDFTFVLGPYYSNSTSLGLGVLASGLYRIDRENRTLPPSSFSVYVNASIIGMYKVGIESVSIFKDDKNRLFGDLSFMSMPTDFWGLGYTDAVHNASTRYTSNRYQINVKYLHRLFRNTYAGACLNFDYTAAKRLKHPEYLHGQKSAYNATGLAILIEYDSRDFIPNPSKGVFLSVEQLFRPRFANNTGHNLWRTRITADYYHKLWKGATVAIDLYGEINSKTTPWVFYAQMGGTKRMRGYYEGRFTDLNVVMAQVEIRQRIWRRIGMTVWGGAGNVFPSFESFDWGQTMPNYGLGLRWEFKNRVNIRFDFGMGRKVQGKMINGFLMSINEAF